MPIEGGDYLERSLKGFINSDHQSAIIPLHLVNHFVGIYIKYNKATEKYHAIYFDPIGSQNHNNIPENIQRLLYEKLDIAKEAILLVKNSIQSYSKDSGALIHDNVHCGAFVAFILSSLANGDILIDINGDLKISYYKKLRSLGNLNAEQSNRLGLFLRKNDHELLRSGEVALWRSGVEELRKIKLVELKNDIKELVKSADSGGVKVTEAQQNYLDGKKHGGLRSTSYNIPIIELGSSLELKYSKKKSGYDENFKTSEAETFAKKDSDFELSKEDVNFKKAHVFSRLRTNDYAHFHQGKITGHPGGIFREKALKSSNAEGSPAFHKDRHSEIESVINDQKIEKKEKAKMATSRALEFVVRRTIGYKDLHKEKVDYSGYTASGHNLSILEQRRLAFKTLQASRDKSKMSYIALTETDTDFSDLNDTSLRIEKAGFSPIRTSTPFSEAVIEYTAEQLSSIDLNADDSYEKIAKVYSNPTPAFNMVSTKSDIPDYMTNTSSTESNPTTSPSKTNARRIKKHQHTK